MLFSRRGGEADPMLTRLCAAQVLYLVPRPDPRYVCIAGAETLWEERYTSFTRDSQHVLLAYTSGQRSCGCLFTTVDRTGQKVASFHDGYAQHAPLELSMAHAVGNRFVVAGSTTFRVQLLHRAAAWDENGWSQWWYNLLLHRQVQWHGCCQPGWNPGGVHGGGIH